MVAAQFETSGATINMTTQTTNPITSPAHTVVGGPGSRRVRLPMAGFADQPMSAGSDSFEEPAEVTTTKSVHSPVRTAKDLQQYVRTVFTPDFTARLLDEFASSRMRQISWNRFWEYPSASLQNIHYLSEPSQLSSRTAHRPAESSSSNSASALSNSVTGRKSENLKKTSDKRLCLFQSLLACHYTSLCPDPPPLASSYRALVGTLAPHERGKHLQVSLRTHEHDWQH